MLAPGHLVDRFEVVSLVGRGGMATVYKVRHRTLGTLHALKVLSHVQPELQRRLVNEGIIQAKLRHPGLVAVTDVIEADGSPALLMEYVEGRTLRDRLDGGPLAVGDALRVARQVLEAVGVAHAAGVLHRDLKPGNILLDVTGTPKVTDFGIAKLLQESTAGTTIPGMVLGTPGYMAPEQALAPNKTDGRADIYSIGAILYEMLAGVPPFRGGDVVATVVASAKGDYVPLGQRVPGLATEVLDAVARALDQDPEKRFESCEEFEFALQLEDVPRIRKPVAGPPPSFGDAAAKDAPDSGPPTGFSDSAARPPDPPAGSSAPTHDIEVIARKIIDSERPNNPHEVRIGAVRAAGEAPVEVGPPATIAAPTALRPQKAKAPPPPPPVAAAPAPASSPAAGVLLVVVVSLALFAGGFLHLQTASAKARAVVAERVIREGELERIAGETVAAAREVAGPRDDDPIVAAVRKWEAAQGGDPVPRTRALVYALAHAQSELPAARGAKETERRARLADAVKRADALVEELAKAREGWDHELGRPEVRMAAAIGLVEL
ncbi:MAG: serine/threonine-protein kinase [Myxococcota bacterium]